jgi:hypothetical protein
MIALLSRVFSALRVWFGLNDPSENHLHPAHGWLLPPSADRRARVPALVPAAPVRLPSARVR